MPTARRIYKPSFRAGKWYCCRSL